MRSPCASLFITVTGWYGNNMDTIVIFDFGGQYCHLISRRIRDFGMHADVVPHHTKAVTLAENRHLRGIILSGGARSVYEKRAPHLDPKILSLHVPILGICYGHQLIAHAVGGAVKAGRAGEYGITTANVMRSGGIFPNTGIIKVWMNHRDIVTRLPRSFTILARTEHSPIAAFAEEKKKIFGVQFHPEVSHTEQGSALLKKFVRDICRCVPAQSSLPFIAKTIAEAKRVVGDERAIIGLSGGVDSSVAAALMSRAIGKNLTAVYVDTGLMRDKETEFIRSTFRRLPLKLKIINAGPQFFKALKGVTFPERKRKIIGKLFAEIFSHSARKEKAAFLIQGTIYSDRIESGITAHSSIIKSHHNVSGLPKNLALKLYEPLRNCYKDEVRRMARVLRLPQEISTQQVFPGPGLAVRIIGEVTPERVKIVRDAGRIIEEELRHTQWWKRIWMSFGVLLPIRNVGIQGDQRSYQYPIVIRIVESKDAMTANFSKIPYPTLERIATRITNEIRAVNRVTYDITNKPPATMEWE